MYHPVREYLAQLTWDGVPRLATWMATYLGAEQSPYSEAVGTIVLIAAVRRIRRPGAKFDTVLVLEGPQGSGKSSAVQILAGPENFSDQDVLALDPKTQIEALEGVWIFEIGELSGISRADTNKVKAFVSRSTDRGRPAYGRFKENRPRQSIFIGTSNDDQYLRDATGNRRFWPVRTTNIDTDGLRRDRDQLWAEAAHRDNEGASIVLPRGLWADAGAEQDQRLERDPWLDELVDLGGPQVGDYDRVTSKELLADYLEIPPERQQPHLLKRLANVMKQLGWDGPKPLKMPGGSTARGYERRHDPSRTVRRLPIKF
jgi:predicted P-loop ATPase